MSTTVISIIIGAALVVVLTILFRALLKAYWRYKGKMLVTCPETEQPAGVEINAKHAAITTMLGGQSLILKECTHWPERGSCGQNCLEQIESSPENCLVRIILTNWYQGKRCVFCDKAFHEIHWHHHKPVLLSPDRRTIEWADIPIDNLPQILSIYKPVCWDCHVAETFRREHSDLVTDRPWKRGRLV